MSAQVAQHGNALSSILAIVFAIFAFLAVAVRMGMGCALSRPLDWDDFAVILSLIFTIGQTTSVAVAGKNGLVSRFDSGMVPPGDVLQKALYSSELLYIASLTMSKLSIPALLLQITPKSGERRMAKVILVAIGLWSSLSFVAATVQCAPSGLAWAISGPSCFDQRSFWIAYYTISVITEVATVLFAVGVIFRSQMTRRRRVTVGLCFCTRLLVVAAIVTQATFSTNLTPGSADRSFGSWEALTCAISVTALSVITACIPYMKSFVSSLESGMIRLDDKHRRLRPTGTFKPVITDYHCTRFTSRVLDSERRPSVLSALAEAHKKPGRTSSVDSDHEMNRIV